MSSEGYEILALFMRFVFTALGLMILLRSFYWLRRDAKAYKKELRRLPDAGLVGEVVNLGTGETYPLPREGVIGSSRGCDIRLREVGIARHHVLFSFIDGKGVSIRPVRGHIVLLDGEVLGSMGYALHGTHLQVGDVCLRVRLFAGLNVPFRAAIAPENEDMPVFSQQSTGYADALTDEQSGSEINWEVPEDTAQPYGAQSNPMEDTWAYAPFPNDAQPYQAEAPRPQGEVPDDTAENGMDEYEPPFEEPKRHRRRERHE